MATTTTTLNNTPHAYTLSARVAEADARFTLANVWYAVKVVAPLAIGFTVLCWAVVHLALAYTGSI